MPLFAGLALAPKIPHHGPRPVAEGAEVPNRHLGELLKLQRQSDRELLGISSPGMGAPIVPWFLRIPTPYGLPVGLYGSIDSGRVADLRESDSQFD